jgi:hypothetical protein
MEPMAKPYLIKPHRRFPATNSHPKVATHSENEEATVNLSFV